MYFPELQNCTVEQLKMEVKGVVEKLGRAPITYTVGTALTTIAHGLGEVPTVITVLPSADARVWQPQAADKQFVYLQASAAVVCTIRIAVA